MKKKKYNDPFRAMHGAAIGSAGIGLTVGAMAGTYAHLPTGSINMSQQLNTVASFTPIATTAVIGKSLLPKKKKYRY